MTQFPDNRDRWIAPSRGAVRINDPDALRTFALAAAGTQTTHQPLPAARHRPSNHGLPLPRKGEGRGEGTTASPPPSQNSGN